MGRALTLLFTVVLFVGCGAPLTSRENANLLGEFDDILDYDNPPVLISAVRPEYSDILREVGAEGKVVLKVLVLEDGTVGKVQIVESPNLILTDQAITAIRKSRFAPATKEGQPCCATAIIPFIFDKSEVSVRTRAGLEIERTAAPVDRTPEVERPDDQTEDFKPQK